MAIPEFKPPGDVPAGPLQWLRDWVTQAALWKQMRDPANVTVGDPLDKFITRREAVTTGVLVPRPGGGFDAGGGTGNGGGTVIITPPAQPYVPDLTPPPTPDGLTVTPGFTVLILTWTAPTYTQGRGHARTLIYGAVWAEGAPPPVFADAQLIDSASGTNIHSFPSGPSTRWAIWIKWQSVDGGISVSPAGGANGVVGTTGVDIAAVIQALTAAAANPLTPYGVFTLRGDLINVADNNGVATNLFNLVTTPITIGGLTVNPGVYLRQAYVHNGFITNAMMGRAVIDDAVISTLSAAKFTGGEMRVNSFLQSSNYTAGPSGAGFKINADGTALLQAAYIRGLLTATQIDTTGLSIKDAAGNVILNAGATPTIGGGVVVSGTGGLSLGELATGFEATPVVTLEATGQLFITPAAGGPPAPATHTLTANAQNIDSPVYEWRVDGVVVAGQTGVSFSLAAFAPGSAAARTVRVIVKKSGDPSVNGTDVVSLYSLREGSDAYGAGLVNESQVVSCDNAGVPIGGQLPILSRLAVVRGAEFLTTGITYSVVSGSVEGLTGVSINSAGDITIANITAILGKATFRVAVTGGPTFDRMLTVTKALAGAPGANNGDAGPPGLRGSLTAYSTSVSPAIYSANPWNGQVDDDQATIVIWRLLGNAGNPPVGPSFYNHLRIGDTVTLTNAAGTASATRFWFGAGSGWLSTGVVISGNLIVGGTIAGGTNLNIAGYARVEGGFGYTLPNPVTGSPLSRTASVVGNTSATQDFGIVGVSTQSGLGAGVYGVNLSLSVGVGVYGRGPTGIYGAASTSGGVGVYGDSTSGVAVYGVSVASFGVRGESATSTGVSGSSSSGTGVFGSSSSGAGVRGTSGSGAGGRFSGAISVQAYGPMRLEGTGTAMRFKPNADSSAGVATVLRTDGGSFLLGITANGNADGDPAQYGLVYNLATGQMLIDNFGMYGMTISPSNGAGYGLATFTGTKPGPDSAQEWVRMEINGRVGRLAIWFDG